MRINSSSIATFSGVAHPSANRAMLLTPQVSRITQNKSLCHKTLKFGGHGHRGFSLCLSIDVGKEENSSVDGESGMYSEAVANPNPRSGLEEEFAVLETGKYECSSCGYIYDRALGDQVYPIAPGLDFSKLPEDWRCPTCGAAQSYFSSKSIEVAGFAQNQQFGLGGNSLTGGQKSALIFGSLLFLFILFLAGYFLQ